MINLSVTVLANEGNEGLRRSLLDRLGEPVQVYRLRPKYKISEANKMMTSYGKEATHHLILQDDVFPCRDFLIGVRKVLESRQKSVVSLYYSRRLGVGTKALCFPVSLIADAMKNYSHLPVLYTVPSLVEDISANPALATRFIGASQSALLVDWRVGDAVRVARPRASRKVK